MGYLQRTQPGNAAHESQAAAAAADESEQPGRPELSAHARADGHARAAADDAVRRRASLRRTSPRGAGREELRADVQQRVAGAEDPDRDAFNAEARRVPRAVRSPGGDLQVRIQEADRSQRRAQGGVAG